MILTRHAILKEIQKGSIRLEPFSEKQVGAASIDLHLGNIFRPLVNARHAIVLDDDAVDGEQYGDRVRLKDGETITLKPGALVLGITKEKITISPNLAGHIEGRSQVARVGLGVHVTSGFIHPGTSSIQVLEISNTSPNELILTPGLKICQIVLERCEGEDVYSGKWEGQVEP